ncbi:MAG: hypothetical protein HZB86_02750 [Deltaproteobacteria bacterium]|nr:hypothetical protein [Deltaproteobacteria bacterium]
MPKSSLPLSELAARIGAVLRGPDSPVRGIAPLEEAGPGQVAFLSNPRYVRLARETKASALIVREPLAGAACAFLLSPNPYDSFARALEIFHPPVRPASGISPQACVDPGASIGKDVSIGPFAVVEKGATVGDRTSLYAGVYVGTGAAVGDDCVLYPRVTLYEGVRVGNRAILHAGCVIGSDGFGFAPSSKGFRKIPQGGIRGAHRGRRRRDGGGAVGDRRVRRRVGNPGVVGDPRDAAQDLAEDVGAAAEAPGAVPPGEKAGRERIREGGGVRCYPSRRSWSCCRTGTRFSSWTASSRRSPENGSSGSRT